tara:strand:+ start:775 stop:1056 length:282 start_codon:yes stop_codon:yes gene_type:complete
MKIIDIMERLGINQTGRAMAYIKDALDEMNLLSETHTKTIRLDIVEGQRFYELPNEAVKILDIRVKNHKNSSNNYQSIPRSTYEPETEDTDGL